MKVFRIIGIALLVSAFGASIASAQSWTPVNAAPQAIGPMLTLRDGRILAHSDQGGDANKWYILSPASNGKYETGTWSGPCSFPSNYSPFFFSTAVLLDGKTVIAEGGEYNFGNADWTNLGALGTYTPWTGCINWVANAPPSGWSRIGDAESDVLPDGTYLQANCCTAQTRIWNGGWGATDMNVHQGNNDESGFTLLPNGKVLTVDTKTAGSCGTSHGYELYSGGAWACGPFGNLPTQLFNPSDEELGAAVLTYHNGTVIQFGGNVVATNLYNPTADTWVVGPVPPQGLDQADGPAALEPNGKVLAQLSPGLFNVGCHFAEFDPVANTITLTVDNPYCPADSSYEGHMMIFPTGQIGSVDYDTTIYLYNYAGSIVPGVAPTIIPATNAYLGGSKNNILYGIQLNGLSENNAYGDDYQAATNYPLIRFTDGSGNVWYGLTHDDSTHSIAPGTISYTKFDLNPAMPPGTYTMQVVTNGIGSNKVTVKIH